MSLFGSFLERTFNDYILFTCPDLAFEHVFEQLEIRALLGVLDFFGTALIYIYQCDTLKAGKMVYECFIRLTGYYVKL